MMKSSTDEARFVTSQKGTKLLRDVNNFNYRIHKKNTDGTKACYRCVKRTVKILQPWLSFISPYHILPPSCMSMFMKPTYSTGGCLHWEKRMIVAATLVGQVSTIEVLSKFRLTFSGPKTPGHVQQEEEQDTRHGPWLQQGEKESHGPWRSCPEDPRQQSLKTCREISRILPLGPLPPVHGLC
jgi:hypothetical protein